MFWVFLVLVIVAIVLLICGFAIDFDGMSSKISTIVSGIICFLVAVGFLVGSMMFVVQPGKIGVEILFGKVLRYASAGFNWKNPLSNTIFFDVRTQKYVTKLESASLDLQNVNMEVSINYRIDSTRVSDLYLNVGKDYIEKVIDPAVLGLAKACVAKYTVENVIVKRADLATDIDNALRSRFLQYFIILENVNINNITFDPDFSKTIEDKQIEEVKIKTAEYQKLQSKQVAEKTIIEANASAERNLIEARAEAKKQELLKQTVSKDVITLKWIEKWNGNLPQMVAGDKGFMPLINVSKDIKKEE